MAKYISILYCLVFWITNCVTHTSSFEWISKPVDLQQCEGDNVDLNWNYNKSSSTHVSLIHWLFLGTGNALAGWDDSTMSYKVYPVYAGRVTPLEHHNAGIRLRDVTPADTGVYKLELGGPGITDTANVTVYNESLLQPSLEVDGDPKNFSMEIVGVEGHKMVFRVTTGTSLKANSIVFTRKGFDGIDEELVVQTCMNQTVCEYSMKLSHSGNFSIYINVTYPVCTPISRIIHLEVQTASTVWIGALVTVGIVLVVISIIAIVVIWHRKKRRAQSKNNNTEQTYNHSIEQKPLNEEDHHTSDDHDNTTKIEQKGEELPQPMEDDHFESEVPVSTDKNDNNTHEQINNPATQHDNCAEQRTSYFGNFKDTIYNFGRDMKEGITSPTPFGVEQGIEPLPSFAP